MAIDPKTLAREWLILLVGVAVGIFIAWALYSRNEIFFTDDLREGSEEVWFTIFLSYVGVRVTFEAVRKLRS